MKRMHTTHPSDTVSYSKITPSRASCQNMRACIGANEITEREFNPEKLVPLMIRSEESWN